MRAAPPAATEAVTCLDNAGGSWGAFGWPKCCLRAVWPRGSVNLSCVERPKLYLNLKGQFWLSLWVIFLSVFIFNVRFWGWFYFTVHVLLDLSIHSQKIFFVKFYKFSEESLKWVVPMWSLSGDKLSKFNHYWKTSSPIKMGGKSNFLRMQSIGKIITKYVSLFLN